MNETYKHIFIPNDIKDKIIRKMNFKGDAKSKLELLFSNKEYERINDMIEGLKFSSPNNIYYQEAQDLLKNTLHEELKKRKEEIAEKKQELIGICKKLNIEIKNLNKKVLINIAKDAHPDNKGEENEIIRLANIGMDILKKYPEIQDELNQENLKEEQVVQQDNIKDSDNVEKESAKNESMQSSSVKEGLLSKEEMVKIVRDITNGKYSPEERDELTKKVYASLAEMLKEKNISSKNLGQFINQEFAKIIKDNVNKKQRDAIRDNIYSEAKVILNSKDRSKNEGMQSITNNIKNVELLKPEERPRERLDYETDKEYEKYLSEFYKQLFPNQINESNIQTQVLNSIEPETKSDNKKDWHPKLTEEQKLDAISRGIYEPIGQEYNQFLREHGIEPEAKNDVPIRKEPPTSTTHTPEPLGLPQNPDQLGLPKNPDPLGLPKNPDPLGLPKPKDEIIDIYPTPPFPPPEEKPQKFETAATIIHSITKEIYDENGELEDIVGARKQDIRHLKYANLKVFDTFKNSFKNGNYIYNLNPANIAKAVISIPANLVMKIYGNIGYGKKTRKRIEILKQRSEALTDEQVEIILKEHTAGQKQDMNFTNVVEELVNRRIQRYQLDKLKEVNIFVNNIVEELIDKKSFIEEIDKSLESDSLTEEQRNKLMEQRAKLLEGCKEQVAMFFEKKEEASKLISHGFSEDTRAKFTKMGYAGKRFSFGQREIKTIEDQQFNQKLADLDLKARHPQTDEEALNAFIENEMFYAENSEIRNSIFGRRDTGKVKNNNRFIVKEQDYRNDPLIGDLIRSAALITSAVSVVTGIKAVKDAEQMRVTHNQDVNNINAQNQEAINNIHKEAQNISSQSQAMIDGAETISMSNSSELGEFFHNIAERVERSKGNSYGQLDQQAHQLYNQYMSNTQNTLSQITKNITSGSLSRSQALQQYGTLNDQLVSDLSSMCQQYGSFMQKYAQSSPNFDYSGTLETINYFSNSHNIKGMFDAMSQSLTSAEAISNLNVQLAPLLDKLPNNIKEQIAAATATTALAYYTSQKINKTYEEGKYGKAQDKLEEYIAKKKAQEEEHIEEYIDEEEIEKDGGRSR